jgi:hypothetical protein
VGQKSQDKPEHTKSAAFHTTYTYSTRVTQFAVGEGRKLNNQMKTTLESPACQCTQCGMDMHA